MVASVQEALTGTGFLQRGDRVVVVAGNPGRAVYQTNSLRIYEMV
jgi:pyruvate kinase